jgi:hypothetical protein
MTNTQIWARRVSDWRASGLPSPAFCKGKPFSAGGLRCWAYRLRRDEARASEVPALSLARVVRVPEPPMAAAPVGGSLVVELAGARVTVPAGFDRATVAAVLDVLVAGGGR